MDKKKYTYQQLHDIYNFHAGYYCSYWECQRFGKSTLVYIYICQYHGTYPDFEREPKYGGLLSTKVKRFLKGADGKFKEVALENVPATGNLINK